MSGLAGALVGGLNAEALDIRLPNKHLNELGESLKPGTSHMFTVSLVGATVEARKESELEDFA